MHTRFMPRYKIVPAILQRLAWGPVRLSFWLFSALEIRGVENLNRIQGNMLIASSHANQFDPILIVACLPFFSRHLPLFFGSREKDFYAKSGWKRLIYGGLFFRMMGGHPMYGGLNDYEAALRHHIEFIRSGESICIFPTGKRRTRNQVPKARGGIGYLARSTGIPILPVKIQGLEDMTFLSLWTGRHKVFVTFGEPIQPSDVFMNTDFIELAQNPYAEVAEIVMEKVEQLA